MRYLLALIVVIGLTGLFPFSSVQAGKKDDAWAACLWKTVPTSAANWLALPKPGSREWSEIIFVDKNFSKTPDEPLTLTEQNRASLLLLRLEAACKDRVAQSHGKSVSFKTNSVRKALGKTIPDSTQIDQIEPEAHLCIFWTKRVVSGMSPGIGSFEQVKLRGDEDALRCFWIADDGSLLDPSSQEKLSERTE